MPPDPNTSTRAEFTASYLAIAPLPADPSVSAKWTRLVNSLLALIKALGEHEAMQRNNQQTYMTPAKDKNAQYFAWDFVGRTIVGSTISVLHSHVYSFRQRSWHCSPARSGMLAIRGIVGKTRYT